MRPCLTASDLNHCQSAHEPAEAPSPLIFFCQSGLYYPLSWNAETFCAEWDNSEGLITFCLIFATLLLFFTGLISTDTLACGLVVAAVATEFDLTGEPPQQGSSDVSSG